MIGVDRIAGLPTAAAGSDTIQHHFDPLSAGQGCPHALGGGGGGRRGGDIIRAMRPRSRRRAGEPVLRRAYYAMK